MESGPQTLPFLCPRPSVGRVLLRDLDMLLRCQPVQSILSRPARQPPTSGSSNAQGAPSTWLCPVTRWTGDRPGGEPSSPSTGRQVGHGYLSLFPDSPFLLCQEQKASGLALPRDPQEARGSEPSCARDKWQDCSCALSGHQRGHGVTLGD